MMGERLVMQESLFYEFWLEDHVPCDPLLRRIDRFVDCSELRQHLAGYYSSALPSLPQTRLRRRVRQFERRLCQRNRHIRDITRTSANSAEADVHEGQGSFSF